MLKWVGFFLLFSLMNLSNASPSIDEDIFREALNYTVKIKTRVDLPFVEDERGAYTGAGFVVDAERGWIMTNAHVAARSPSFVTVAFRGGDFQPAEKLYVDPYLDLAILRLLDPSRVPTKKSASLECDLLPSIGHPVGALGHPWDISFTGTRGVISGLTDKFGTEVLQTDAPINSGNSGGPLISMETAKVVGINTSSINKNRDQNTNFATPMKYACRVLQLLQNNQEPSPPEMPIVFFTDLDDSKRLTVASSNLASDLIALKNGDIVEGVVGEKDVIQNESQLIHALRGHLSDLNLKIERAGEKIELKGKFKPATRVTERQGVFVSGLLIAPWWTRDWTELNLPRLVVHSVEPGSIGDNQSIHPWDNIVAIDDKSITDLPSLVEYLKKADTQGKTIKLKLKRFSNIEDRLYEYIERPLEIQGVRIVGKTPLQ